MMPWSIDIWSLGAILLEAVIGFPLWLTYKGRIVMENNNKKSGNQEEHGSSLMTGLFSV